MGAYKDYVYSKRLKTIRKQKRITIKQMAKLLSKKSHVSYANIENGFVEPKISIMNKISHILEKPVDYFFKIGAVAVECSGREGA